MHAFAVRSFENLIGERERSRVHHVPHAQRMEHLSLGGRASRCENLRSCALRQLHRREANTAGCRVNQYAIAAAQPARRCRP